MQGYVPGQDGAFGESRKCFGELEDWLASEEAAGLQHGELEEQLDVRGRALLRQLFQDRLDLTAAREERRHDVTGPDGVPRTRAEKGRTRPLVTRFGQVTVSRIAYRSPGRSNVHLLDAALNLPEEKHSHGLRKLAAVEAVRGSIEAAGDAVARATGVRIGKRQLEELARRAAAHVEAFYLWRAISPAPEAWPLVLTFDGKGIVMLPEALRPATAKAAAAAQGKLATRLSPGEKNGRKRMAELACVYDAAPVPRTPGDVISTPAQKRRKNQAQAGKPKGKQKPREPQARGKWLTASVTDDIPAVIAAAFDEAERRDLQHKREWVVLVDGNNTQDLQLRGLQSLVTVRFGRLASRGRGRRGRPLGSARYRLGGWESGPGPGWGCWPRSSYGGRVVSCVVLMPRPGRTSACRWFYPLPARAITGSWGRPGRGWRSRSWCPGGPRWPGR